MSNKVFHPFHLVELSSLPILLAFSIFVFAIGAVTTMHKYYLGYVILTLGTLSIIICLYYWWKNIINEGLIYHTVQVRQGLRIGMVLFIISELMLFFGIFSSFFKASIFPVGITDGLWVIKQGIWPPEEIILIDPWNLPLLNTVTLLLSGTTITWAHYALNENNQKDFIRGIGCTIILGLFFTIVQGYEYLHADFSISSGIYGANFYLATGFHGIHVIVGNIFLIICYFRAKKSEFVNSQRYLGFEFAAWYWHFINIIWLFLFAFVYIWGR